MKSMNLFTGADLKKLSEAEMTRHFGKSGRFYYDMVRGIDNRPVQPHRETKSVASEDTFEHDLELIDEMNTELLKIAGRLSTRLQKYKLAGRTLTLKVKFSDFKQITRNHAFEQLVSEGKTLYEAGAQLLSKINLSGKKVRLLGLSVSNFTLASANREKPGNDAQLKLF